MKKLMYLLIAAFLVTFTACGGDKTATEETVFETAVEEVEKEVEKEVEEERQVLLDKSIDRKYPNLVGTWVLNENNYNSVLNSIVRIYKKGGIYYQSMVFDRDGSESVLKLNKRSDKRYDVIGKSDYNVINSEGYLEFWDEQGYFLTCY